MSKKLGIAAIILCIIALGISIAALTMASGQANNQEQPQDIQYVMYLGTNDKDTNEPVYPPKEAKTKAEDILLDYFGGYTIQEASGGWVDDNKVYREYTLVIYLSDTDLDHVHEAADKLVSEFHQSSVLIQANETTTEFYSGEE